MKVKLKLDSQKLKRLALEHVEKVAFGILALAALMMAFKSFGLPKFDKVPADLQSVSSRAKAALETPESTATEVVHSELKPKEFLTIASKNTEKFKADGYSWDIVKPPAYPTGGRRQEPQYFVVEDLHAIPGRQVFVASAAAAPAPLDNDIAAEGQAGDLPMNKDEAPKVEKKADPPKRGSGNGMNRKPMNREGDAGGGAMDKPRRAIPSAGNSEGLSYVAVIGKVPFGKQLKTYRDAFGTAEHRLSLDGTPTYLDPRVERAEVVSGVADADLKWVNISKPESPSSETKSRLSPMLDPFLDPQFELQPLTGSLYSLSIGEWDPEGVVPKEFRLKEVPASAVAASDAPTDEVADASGNPDDPPAADAPDGPDSEGPPAAAATRPGGSGTVGRPMGGTRPMGQKPMGGNRPMGQKPMGGKPMGAKPMGGGAGRNMAGNAPNEAKTAEYVLFRFLDFSAEPGKRYRYRVKLWLQNPNEGVAPQFLENEQLAKLNFRGTELSPPTEPVTVPNDGAVIAGMYNPPSGWIEGSASVLVTQFIQQGGQTAVKKLDKFFRGQVANLDATDALILEQETGELLPWDQKVEFRSNAMLLDVAQADRNKPADVLVLDAEGKLVVLSAEAEEEQFRDLSDKIKKAVTPKKPDPDKEKEKDRKGGGKSMDRGKRDKADPFGPGNN